MRRSFVVLVILSLLACTSGLRADEPLSARRARVEALSPEEKAELRQKEERFVSLPDNEKERLRKLHEELNSSSDSSRLKEVLERYHAWLATLSSTERIELEKLDGPQRVAWIKKKMAEQEEYQFHQIVRENFQPEDRRAVFQWLDAFIDGHKDEILASIPEEFRPRDLEGRNRWGVMVGVLQRWGANDPKMLRPTQDEVKELIGSLSPKAQQSLEKVRDPAQRTKLAYEWIRAAARNMRPMPPASTEELQKFLKETLTAQERERLESLPGEKMPFELQRLYNEHRWRTQWSRGGGGRGGGGPDGPFGFGPGGPGGGPGGPPGGPEDGDRPPRGNGDRGGRGRGDDRPHDVPRDDKGPRDDKKGPREPKVGERPSPPPPDKKD